MRIRLSFRHVAAIAELGSFIFEPLLDFNG